MPQPFLRKGKERKCNGTEDVQVRTPDETT
jgi:hypothetical protein